MPRTRTPTYKNLKRPAGLLVVDNIRARTESMRVLLQGEQPADPTDTRLQEITDLIAGSFGCHAVQTRKLTELVLQVELPPAALAGGQIPWVLGALIVMENGTDVRSAKLIYATDSDADALYFYINDAGNLTSESYINGRSPHVRPATDDEITAWVTAAGLVS